MAVSDYSSTPASNTAISGIDVSENCAPAGMNDAFRQLMADIADWYAGRLADGSQPLDATLSALAALNTIAGSMIYATGADAFAVAASTAYGRSLLNTADAAAAQTALGVAASPTISGTATSGKVALGPLTLTWKDVSITNGTTTYTYGNAHTYASWARGWLSGDDSIADVSAAITVHGTSTATIKSVGSTFNGVLFAIGV